MNDNTDQEAPDYIVSMATDDCLDAIDVRQQELVDGIYRLMLDKVGMVPHIICIVPGATGAQVLTDIDLETAQNILRSLADASPA